MARNEYYEYMEKPAIGYLPLASWGGLEILDIINGIEDEVVACFNWGADRQMIRRHVIHYTPAGRAYFRKMDRRYYLDEIQRV